MNKENIQPNSDQRKRTAAEVYQEQAHAAAEKGNFKRAHSRFLFAWASVKTVVDKNDIDKINEASLLAMRGKAAIANGDPETGVSICYDAIKRFAELLAQQPESFDDDTIKSNIAVCHKIIAESRKNQNLYCNAIFSYQAALEMMKIMNEPDVKEMADCLQELGHMFIKVTRYDQAINSFLQAINKLKPYMSDASASVAVVRLLADCYAGLGFAYYLQNEEGKSLEAYAEEYKILITIPEKDREEEDLKNLQFLKTRLADSELIKGVDDAKDFKTRCGM